MLRVLIVGLLLLASAGDRRRDHALVAAPLASLLVTPYSGFQDLAMLVGAAWIWLRQSPEWQVRAWLLLGWVAAEFTLVWGPYPIVGYELAWMVVLAVLGLLRLRRSPVATREPVDGLGARRPEPRSAAPAGPDRAARLPAGGLHQASARPRRFSGSRPRVWSGKDHVPWPLFWVGL